MSAHRYWRIYITATVGGGYIELSEVEWRDALGGANLATGGVASESSYDDIGSTGAHAFDGDAVTRWATAGGQATPSWLAYDFGAAVEPASLMIRNAQNPPSGNPIGNAPSAFRIEYSDDGLNWFDSGFAWSSLEWLTAGQAKEFAIVWGVFSGVVTDSTGTPCARTVIVHRRDTRSVIGEATSNATTGAFEIESSYEGECYVVFLDDDAGADFNALIFDRVTAV